MFLVAYETKADDGFSEHRVMSKKKRSLIQQNPGILVEIKIGFANKEVVTFLLVHDKMIKVERSTQVTLNKLKVNCRSFD